MLPDYVPPSRMATHREWLIYMRANKEHTCRMRKHFLLAVLCLCVPFVAFADTITRVAPATWYVGATEEFLSLGGSGIRGGVSTDVTFSGPAGRFSVEAQPGDSPDAIETWIPAQVLLAAGSYQITVVATDATGAIRSFGPASMSVIERPIEQPPLISLPESVRAEATSRDGAIVDFNASATGYGASAPTVQCNRQSGSQFPLGSTFVTCTASDGFGSTDGGFNVIVSDTVKPVITVPADIVTTSAVVNFDVSATDEIFGNIVPVCFPKSGSTFPTGKTLVRCTATDDDANEALGSFNVTVTGAGAGVPVLSLPADISVEATSPLGAMVTYTATATDAEDGNVPVTCNPESGSVFALGTETIVCSATDLQGHTTEGMFLVTVRDTTPPVITRVEASVPVLWPPDHRMVAERFTVVATDNGDANPISRIVSITSNQPINGPGDGNTDPDYQITGPLTANLRAERSSGNDRIYTITIATTDASGNTASRTCEVRVTVTQPQH